MAKCPICKAKTNPDFRPFCSRRCSDRDLLNWLDGRYSAPAGPTLDDDPDSDGPAATKH